MRRRKAFRSPKHCSAARWRIPGAICRVAGHTGRYLGHDMGAYLAQWDANGQRIEPPVVRVYRATPPRGIDHHAVFSELDQSNRPRLPSDEQLSAACREYNIPHP